ncbi:MAG TPA: AMIN domain-containing protein [Terriglobia bacterium]|nr:AMIN domain-containing protein [Terriglobia bacterium]
MASHRPLMVGRIIAAVLISMSLPSLDFRSSPAAFNGFSAPAQTPQASTTQTPQASTTGTVKGAISVSGVSIQSPNPGETDIGIATLSNITYKALELQGPHRLVVDLQGAIKATPQSVYAAKSPFLSRVRVSQFQKGNPSVVRIVVDLAGDPSYSVAPVPTGILIALKTRISVPPPVAIPIQQPPVATPAQAPAPPPQNVPPPPSAFFIKLPYNSLIQNERVLDSLGLRIVMSLNYRKGSADEAAWKTKGAPGVAASRVFIKPIAPGSYQTIELAVSPAPQGGFELAVYCQKAEQNVQGPNPDFFPLQQLVNDQVTQIAQAPPPTEAKDLAYQIYYLSYTVADHAIALLKTMGYTTVEYNTQAGENNYQNIYNPIKLGTKPPIIVKLIDSSKTSIMDNPPSGGGSGAVGVPQAPQPQMAGQTAGTSAGVPAIGGTYLHSMTTGEPQERLLILYDKNDTDSLQSLLSLLQETIDVPSREILIDALVIELNSNKTRDLGITFGTTQNKTSLFSVDTDATSGAALPFTFTFDKLANGQNISVATFKASLNALLQNNEAEILSNPSVLVLDDRQARIQIGQQQPVIKQVSTTAGIISSVDYFPIGIVLNMRPRISGDGNDVTMQTETIVSAIDATATKALGSNAFLSPVVDNREVQSIVRVADNTPFIIGGLISTNNSTQTNGIPLLAQIPWLGALFRNSTTTKIKQEVIIVITPHVIPLEDKYFSYIIPKDSGQFDRFNYGLFRNAYRIRGNDLFDLSFVYDSNVYKGLRTRVAAMAQSNPNLTTDQGVASVLEGGVPGEDIMVRRMLWEIINKTKYAQYIKPESVFFFEDTPSAPGGFKNTYPAHELKNAGKSKGSAMAISFEAAPKGTEDRPFVPPKGVVSFPIVTHQNYMERLINGNDKNPDGSPKDWMVLLDQGNNGVFVKANNTVTPFELLRGVLVLKRVLELNETLPLTLKDFHIGRQIIFPSQEELEKGFHVIDRQTAKLFYEVFNYYPAFEQEFNRQTRQINSMLDKAENHQP